MAERTISEVLNKPDLALEMTLRPSLFSEFTGQEKVKDRLENRVHDWVCAGKIGLRPAQRQIAGNWQALYRKVFGVAPA